MTRYSVSDVPLESPDQDRLDVVPHATKLAEMLDGAGLPFTAGIYGPWGAGKTTFANLLVKQLREREGWNEPGKVLYVRFSAWPFVTAEAIWRALLERMTDEIFGCATPTKDDRDGWRGRLGEKLLERAVTLRPGESEQEQRARLVSSFARAAPLANRTPTTAHAVAGLVIDAAATVAPAVGPLRRLLGGEGAEGTASAESVRTVEDVKDGLKELFCKLAKRRLIVFIDDLDRCPPEVALDLLETIKIFFFESQVEGAQCLFLVAADERLIERGLSVRLGAGERGIGGVETRAYLEKIFQLGVPLPEAAPRQLHDLVAAWAPEWATAADLIVTPLDRNPRRIKQQCSLLSYRFLARPDPAPLEPKCRTALDELTRAYGVAAKPRTDDEARIHAEAMAATTAPKLAILEGLAGARPGENGFPVTDDRVFDYILATVAKQKGMTTAERLNQVFLQAVLRLSGERPELVAALRKLAKGHPEAYAGAVAELDDWLNAERAGKALRAPVSPEAEKLIELCRPHVARETDEPVLTASPRIAEIPREHVEAIAPEHIRQYEEDRGRTNDKGIVGAIWAAMQTVEKIWKQGGDVMLAQRLAVAVPVRLQVALDVLERRKFAKVQILQTRWPALAGHTHSPSGLMRLRDLELRVREPEATVTLSNAFEELAADERLQELLRLPPFFHEIFPREMAKLAGPGPAVTVAEPPPAPVPPEYADVELRLEVLDAADAETVDVNVHLAGANGDGHAATIALPIAEIEERLSRLAPLYLSGAAPVARDVAVARAGSLSAGEHLRELGELLWSTTFGADANLGAAFDTLLGKHERVRILLHTNSARLARLPWECLHIPDRDTFSGLSLLLSVVRNVPETVKLPPPKVRRPLRILVAVASPQGFPLPGAEQEVASITQVVAKAVDPSAIDLETLLKTTENDLRRTLQRFEPQVFHFAGHGFVEGGTGYLALLGEDEQVARYPAVDMGELLREREILFAVLNGCTTGFSDGENLAGGVAQFLVAKGVPAAIATTRTVTDDQALEFAEQLYAALTTGDTLEVALVEARKALALAGRDWSAYVMYAAGGCPFDALRVLTR